MQIKISKGEGKGRKKNILVSFSGDGVVKKKVNKTREREKNKDTLRYFTI
jgi:hypothetical protein